MRANSRAHLSRGSLDFQAKRDCFNEKRALNLECNLGSLYQADSSPHVDSSLTLCSLKTPENCRTRQVSICEFPYSAVPPLTSSSTVQSPHRGATSLPWWQTLGRCGMIPNLSSHFMAHTTCFTNVSEREVLETKRKVLRTRSVARRFKVSIVSDDSSGHRRKSWHG